MHYFASSAVSFTVSVIVNYILSMRFVFTGKEDMTKAQEMVNFCGTQYDRACDEPDDHVVCRRTFRNVLCSSKIFSTMLVTTYNFISRKRFLEA